MPNMGFRRVVTAITVVTLAVLMLLALPSKGTAQLALYDSFLSRSIDNVQRVP